MNRLRVIRAARLACGLAALLAASVSPAAVAQKDTLKKIKDEIGLLESVLNRSIAQTFPTPFGILDKAQGAYLPGYGAIFDLELNLSPATSLGPFSSLPTPQQLRAQRETVLRRQKEAKELAQRVLAEFGHTLTDLGPSESVAIVIHTVAVREHGLERSVIVVQATKKAIDEYRSNAIDRATFLRKLDIVEY